MRNQLFDGVQLFTLGFCLPLLLDGALLHVFPYNPHGIAWWVSAGTGFYFVTKGRRLLSRLLIAVAYFPFMFVVFFFGGMLVPFLTFRMQDFP
jgi:hypothetical protein